MTESEWLACSEPTPMLALLRDKASDRKLRLFACACARRILPRTKDKPTVRRTIEFAERYADGLSSREELHGNAWGKTGSFRSVVQRHAWDAATDSSEGASGMVQHQSMEANPALLAEFNRILDHAWLERGFHLGEAVRIAERSSPAEWVATAHSAREAEQKQQAHLLRDIFGNPFASVAVDPAWHNSTIHELAQAIYDTRDFSGMPILADALEDAGCADAALLAHCREPGEHVRGCWALDLLLGKA